MTQKALRALARETLGKYLNGTRSSADIMVRDAAIAVLNAPEREGE